MNATSPIAFAQGRPFFEMVTSFLAATIGLGPLFEENNPLALGPSTLAWYRGKVVPNLVIDMGQVHAQCVSGALTADAAVKSLCCMLLNTAYAAAEPHRDQSPEFEVFRHVRNAASHGNKFNFHPDEPRRPAAWGAFRIDNMQKGSANPLFGLECIGATISPADALALLHDVEGRLP
ncbi:MAG: hypothetical protein ACHQ1G_02595 [Planctomycetota bacterium]